MKWTCFLKVHVSLTTPVCVNVSAVFKGSLTCRSWYCMWTLVAAAVHIVTNCPYVCNRCALETWGATPRATSSPGPSLLTCPSKLCVCISVSYRDAHRPFFPLYYLHPVQLDRWMIIYTQNIFQFPILNTVKCKMCSYDIHNLWLAVEYSCYIPFDI